MTCTSLKAFASSHSLRDSPPLRFPRGGLSFKPQRISTFPGRRRPTSDSYESLRHECQRKEVDMRYFFALIVVAATLGAQQTVTSPRPPEAGDGVRGYTDTPRLPGQTWRVHDADRPRPKKVAPGPMVSAPPPSDAIVLFDGKDLSDKALSHWVTAGRGGVIQEPKWKVENGY